MRRLLLLCLLVVGLVPAVWVARAFQARAATEPALTTYAPEGALLTVESRDFHALLRSWTGSEEARRWLASEDDAGFSRSRLFGRLHDAQTQFQTTAGLAPDGSFLASVAGDRSLLAWYGIGDLRFLYITHMAPGAAEKTPLFALRSRFETRQVGSSTFYVRSEGDPERTVAFAAHGDLLLLATDEQVLASALSLLDTVGTRTVANESWYGAAAAAAGRGPGDLRMTLNLAKLVPLPYFRSYWVQRNVSEMKLYRAAVTDVDVQGTPGSFREERVLLPADGAAASSGNGELGRVLAYLPADTGVYRATPMPSVDGVLGQLEDKLLTRGAGASVDRSEAPEAELTAPQAGDSGDLDERIDAAPVLAESRQAQLAGLARVLDAGRPRAMLVYQTTTPGRAEMRFVPVHTAVVVEGAQAWDLGVVEQALVQALEPRLGVGAGSLSWQPRQQGAVTRAELSGFSGLVVAVQGAELVVASDGATLEAMCEQAANGKRTTLQAVRVAGFAHGAERGALVQMVRALDGYSGPKKGVTPPFFAGNMASLSESFAALDAETVRETLAEDGTTHQTVMYTWRR